MPQDIAVGYHGLFVTGDNVRGSKVVQKRLFGQLIHCLHERKLKAYACLCHNMVNLAKLANQAVFIFLRDNQAGRTDNE